MERQECKKWHVEVGKLRAAIFASDSENHVIDVSCCVLGKDPSGAVQI